MSAPNNSTNCISSLRILWPFPKQLDGCQLALADFQHGQVSPAEYAALDLPWQAKMADKRRTEFYAGRLCALRAAAELASNTTAPIAHPEHNYPVWPEGLCGSISHSKGLAAAIVAKKQNWRALGLDLELIMPLQRAEKLQASIASADEIELVQQASGLDYAHACTLLFSAKESLFKALYPLSHIFFGFQDARLEQIDEQGSFKICLLKTLNQDWPSNTLLTGYWALLEKHVVTLISIK